MLSCIFEYLSGDPSPFCNNEAYALSKILCHPLVQQASRIALPIYPCYQLARECCVTKASLAQRFSSDVENLANPTILRPWNTFLEGRSLKPMPMQARLMYPSTSAGNSFVKVAHTYVCIDKEVAKVDPDAALWFMKREWAVINKSMGLIQHSWKLINTALIASCFTSIIYHTVGAVLSQLVGQGLRNETSAELFACEHSSENELKGALRFFTALEDERRSDTGPDKNSFDSRSFNPLKLVIAALQKRFGYSKLAILSHINKEIPGRIQQLRNVIYAHRHTPS